MSCQDCVQVLVEGDSVVRKQGTELMSAKSQNGLAILTARCSVVLSGH